MNEEPSKHSEGGKARAEALSSEERSVIASKAAAARWASKHSLGSKHGEIIEQAWDKEKYPEKSAWEIAVSRAERAREYARKFPSFIHGSDLKFQEVDWQYENEGLPAIKRSLQESKVER